MSPTGTDEFEVAFVEVAHGGHEADSVAREPGEHAAHFVDAMRWATSMARARQVKQCSGAGNVPAFTASA